MKKNNNDIFNTSNVLENESIITTFDAQRLLRITPSDDSTIQDYKERLAALSNQKTSQKSELEFLNEKYRDIKTIIENNPSEKLFKVDESIDEEIVSSINNQGNLNSLIKDFSDLKLGVIGTKVAKKVAIQFINIIKDHEFRETENGKIIYDSYRELLISLNPNRLLWEENIVIRDGIFKNTYYYLLIACDLDCIENAKDFCKELMPLMNGSIVSIPKSIPPISDIKDAINNQTAISINEIQENHNVVNKEIDQLHNEKQANVKKIGKFLYAGCKILAGNPLGMALIVGGGGIGLQFLGNMIVKEGFRIAGGNYFSETRPIVVRENNVSEVRIGHSNTDVSDALTNLISSLKEYFHDLWK